MRKLFILLITICLLVAGFIQAKTYLYGWQVNIRDVPDVYLKQKLLIEETNDGDYALIKAAKITEITAAATTTGTSTADLIKIEVFGQTYKVSIARDTNVVRFSWMKLSMDLSDFSVGDVVNVYGTLDNADPFLIKAITVRNVSIQKNHVNLIGEITAINSSSTLTFKQEKKGIITVTTDSSTKIYSGSKTISFSDLKVGDKVLIRGILNSTQGKLDANLIRLYPNQVCPMVCPCKGCNVTSTTPTGTTPTTTPPCNTCH